MVSARKRPCPVRGVLFWKMSICFDGIGLLENCMCFQLSEKLIAVRWKPGKSIIVLGEKLEPSGKIVYVRRTDIASLKNVIFSLDEKKELLGMFSEVAPGKKEHIIFEKLVSVAASMWELHCVTCWFPYRNLQTWGGGGGGTRAPNHAFSLKGHLFALSLSY